MRFYKSNLTRMIRFMGLEWIGIGRLCNSMAFDSRRIRSCNDSGSFWNVLQVGYVNPFTRMDFDFVKRVMIKCTSVEALGLRLVWEGKCLKYLFFMRRDICYRAIIIINLRKIIQRKHVSSEREGFLNETCTFSSFRNSQGVPCYSDSSLFEIKFESSSSSM